MIAKRAIIATVMGLGLLGAGLYFTQVPNSRPVLIDAYAPPRLVITPSTLALGTVMMDQDVPATFELVNHGGKVLTITKVEPSCGCTTTTLTDSTLDPGQAATLAVTVDTRLKLGDMTKTIDVFSNDPKSPQQTLTLTATVQAPKGSTHNGMVSVNDPLVLFKGQCATCHVDRGVGKTGQALFIADCGMCHGADGGGGVAPKLTAGNYDDAAYVAYVRQMITKGSPTNPGMGPYGKSNGGPLSDSQIDSLIQYLKYQHQQSKVAPKVGSAKTS
jgi:mono/diheme cytochrome c family protein